MYIYYSDKIRIRKINTYNFSFSLRNCLFNKSDIRLHRHYIFVNRCYIIQNTNTANKQYHCLIEISGQMPNVVFVTQTLD